MRGKRPAIPHLLTRWGLIPAHAGKTADSQPRPPSPPAHPRACGENKGVAVLGKGMKGSSPRMRGKLSTSLRAGKAGRLIPAHAGKTAHLASGDAPAPAHPRACGENLKFGSVGSEMEGSSPRMRGKPIGSASTAGMPRLIPAHAGKTPRPSSSPKPMWAHPRACGENGREGEYVRTVEGSSPRMRGKPIRQTGTVRAAWLIPAHAGKTSSCAP